MGVFMFLAPAFKRALGSVPNVCAVIHFILVARAGFFFSARLKGHEQ